MSNLLNASQPGIRRTMFQIKEYVISPSSHCTLSEIGKGAGGGIIGNVERKQAGEGERRVHDYEFRMQ